MPYKIIKHYCSEVEASIFFIQLIISETQIMKLAQDSIICIPRNNNYKEKRSNQTEVSQTSLSGYDISTIRFNPIITGGSIMLKI